MTHVISAATLCSPATQLNTATQKHQCTIFNTEAEMKNRQRGRVLRRTRADTHLMQLDISSSDSHLLCLDVFHFARSSIRTKSCGKLAEGQGWASLEKGSTQLTWGGSVPIQQVVILSGVEVHDDAGSIQQLLVAAGAGNAVVAVPAVASVVQLL